MSTLDLTPPAGTPITRISADVLRPSARKKSPTQTRYADEDAASDSNTQARLQLKPTFSPAKKTELVRTTSKKMTQDLERHKQITHHFRYRLFSEKMTHLQSPQIPSVLQRELTRLRAGGTLSPNTIKMLLVHMVRLGVDIHKFNSKAMAHTDAINSPRLK